MANIHMSYWDQGIGEVERMTGLGRLPSPTILAGDDIRNVCLMLGINLPVASLLDLGCGTGRLAPLAVDWTGVEISPSAVAYCQARHLPVSLIDGPTGLAGFPADRFDWVWACSVFTHIDRDEQQRYLAECVRVAPQILVDILVDEPGRSCARWGSDPHVFRTDLEALGYVVSSHTHDVVDGHGPTAPKHRYFVGRRA